MPDARSEQIKQVDPFILSGRMNLRSSRYPSLPSRRSPSNQITSHASITEKDKFELLDEEEEKKDEY